MIKSMTGFGRSEQADAKHKFTVEVKAVNHRYCDVSVKLPKKFSFFEAKIRNELKKYACRGKIDIFVSYEDYKEGTVNVRYHEGIARQYLDGLSRMAEEFCLENDIRVSALSRYPEVFSLEENPEDEEDLWNSLEEPLHKALKEFSQAREREGEHLYKDILEKLDRILVLISRIEERSPELVGAYRNRILEKVKELLADTQVSEAVLATEITVYADKVCVDEETVRLRSHVKSMQNCLEQGENIGRKLDFIAQEMNREANTILSKANDMEISEVAIDLKTEIEKIREQIQNIE